MHSNGSNNTQSVEMEALHLHDEKAHCADGDTPPPQKEKKAKTQPPRHIAPAASSGDRKREGAQAVTRASQLERKSRANPNNDDATPSLNALVKMCLTVFGVTSDIRQAYGNARLPALNNSSDVSNTAINSYRSIGYLEYPLLKTHKTLAKEFVKKVLEIYLDPEIESDRKKLLKIMRLIFITYISLDARESVKLRRSMAIDLLGPMLEAIRLFSLCGYKLYIIEVILNGEYNSNFETLIEINEDSFHTLSIMRDIKQWIDQNEYRTSDIIIGLTPYNDCTRGLIENPIYEALYAGLIRFNRLCIDTEQPITIPAFVFNHRACKFNIENKLTYRTLTFSKHEERPTLDFLKEQKRAGISTNNLDSLTLSLDAVTCFIKSFIEIYFKNYTFGADYAHYSHYELSYLLCFVNRINAHTTELLDYLPEGNNGARGKLGKCAVIAILIFCKMIFTLRDKRINVKLLGFFEFNDNGVTRRALSCLMNRALNGGTELPSLKDRKTLVNINTAETRIGTPIIVPRDIETLTELQLEAFQTLQVLFKEYPRMLNSELMTIEGILASHDEYPLLERQLQLAAEHQLSR